MLPPQELTYFFPLLSYIPFGGFNKICNVFLIGAVFNLSGAGIWFLSRTLRLLVWNLMQLKLTSQRSTLTLIARGYIIFNGDNRHKTNLILYLIGSVCLVYFKQTDSYFFQINFRENRGSNQTWTIQRHCQYWLLKTHDEIKHIKQHTTEK